MESVNEGISILSADVNEVTELLCFEAAMYHTNFVYMKMADGEFLIPYGSRPDLTGLENGELYTPQEVSNTLAISFDGVYSTDENAGVATQEYRNDDLNGGAVALVVLVVGAVFLIRKQLTH